MGDALSHKMTVVNFHKRIKYKISQKKKWSLVQCIGFGSIYSGSGSSILGWIPIRIQGFDDKKWIKFTGGKKFFPFSSLLHNILFCFNISFPFSTNWNFVLIINRLPNTWKTNHLKGHVSYTIFVTINVLLILIVREVMRSGQFRGQESLGPLKISLEMVHKVICPQKEIISRTF